MTTAEYRYDPNPGQRTNAHVYKIPLLCNPDATQFAGIVVMLRDLRLDVDVRIASDRIPEAIIAVIFHSNVPLSDQQKALSLIFKTLHGLDRIHDHVKVVDMTPVRHANRTLWEWRAEK